MSLMRLCSPQPLLKIFSRHVPIAKISKSHSQPRDRVRGSRCRASSPRPTSHASQTGFARGLFWGCLGLFGIVWGVVWAAVWGVVWAVVWGVVWAAVWGCLGLCGVVVGCLGLFEVWGCLRLFGGVWGGLGGFGYVWASGFRVGAFEASGLVSFGL